jgi:hypothetical protein
MDWYILKMLLPMNWIRKNATVAGCVPSFAPMLSLKWKIKEPLSGIRIFVWSVAPVRKTAPKMPSQSDPV